MTVNKPEFEVIDGGQAKRFKQAETHTQPERTGFLRKLRGLAQAAFAFKNTPETVEMAFRDNRRIQDNIYNIQIARNAMARNAMSAYREQTGLDTMVRANSRISHEISAFESENDRIKYGRVTIDQIDNPIEIEVSIGGFAKIK